MNFIRIILLILALATEAAAERTYIMGSKVDFVSAFSNNPTGSGFYLNGVKSLSTVTGAYPSLNVKSTGEHSTLELDYTLGLSRVNSGLNLTSESHVSSARFSKSFKRWKYNLSETFQMTPDFATFNTLRGVVPEEDGSFRFLFYPVLVRGSSQTNNAVVESSYTINEKSDLSFNTSHTLRSYTGRLAGQERLSAGTTYKRKQSEQNFWSVEYTLAYYNFEDFEKARSHALVFLYSRQFRPTVTVKLSGGPVYTNGSLKKYVGYDTSVSLQKQIAANMFSFTYLRSSGESIGYGYVSDTRQISVTASRRLTRKLTGSIDMSMFDSRGKVANAYTTRANFVSTTLAWSLSRTLSINWGAQYQKYSSTALSALDQKRFFFSLKLDNPGLLRFSK